MLCQQFPRTCRSADAPRFSQSRAGKASPVRRVWRPRTAANRKRKESKVRWAWMALVLVFSWACNGSPGYLATDDLAEASERPTTNGTSTGQTPALDTALAAELSQAFRGAARRTLPAVVYVQTQRNGERQAQNLPLPEPFREFFGMPEEGYELPPE